MKSILNEKCILPDESTSVFDWLRERAHLIDEATQFHGKVKVHQNHFHLNKMFIKIQIHQKSISSKNHFQKKSFIKNQFHQKPVSSKTTFIKNHIHQKPHSSKTTFIKNHIHEKPHSSKTTFIKNHFHQKTTFIRKPVSSKTLPVSSGSFCTSFVPWFRVFRVEETVDEDVVCVVRAVVPFSSETTFIENQFHQKTNFIKKNTFIKTNFIRDHFHQKPLPVRGTQVEGEGGGARGRPRPQPPPPEQKQSRQCLCGRNRLWPIRFWPSLSDRLWPN